MWQIGGEKLCRNKILQDMEREAFSCYPIACLNRCLHLNGDYVCENEKNTLCDTGVRHVPAFQPLAFSAIESGPQDGVYQDCSLRYEDNALLILKKSNPTAEYRYLANRRRRTSLPIKQRRLQRHEGTSFKQQ